MVSGYFRDHEKGWKKSIVWTLFLNILSQQLVSYSPARESKSSLETAEMNLSAARFTLYMVLKAWSNSKRCQKKKAARLPDTGLTKYPRGILMAVLSELYRLCWYAKDTNGPLEQVWGAITAVWLLFYPSWLVSVLLPQDQFEGRTVVFVLPSTHTPPPFPQKHRFSKEAVK